MKDLPSEVLKTMKYFQAVSFKQGARATAMTVLDRISDLQSKHVPDSDVIKIIKEFCIAFYDLKDVIENDPKSSVLGVR